MTTELVSAPPGDAAESDAPAGASGPRGPLISLLGVVKGGSVAARNALIGAIAADDARLERGFTRMILAGERAEIHQAGAQLIVAGGNVTLERGGAQAIIANGSVRIAQGGAGVAVGRRVEVSERGVVLIALAPSLTVAGGRVLVGPLGAVAIISALVAAVLATAGIRHRRRQD